LNFNDEFGISIEETRQETAFYTVFNNKLKQGLLNKLVIQSAKKEVTLFKIINQLRKDCSCYSGFDRVHSQPWLYRFEKT
jgi:hypothetical protein